MADLTGKSFGVAGVNAATNFTKSYAYRVDFSENTEAQAGGTHSLFTIPAGEAVVGIKTVPLAAASVSQATTTAVMGVKYGTASHVGVGTATILGFGTATQVFGGGGNYVSDKPVTIVFVPGSSFTGLDLLVEVDTVPAKAFVTKG